MNVSERLSDMQYTPVSVAFSCGKKFFRFSLMIIYQLLCSPTYVHLCKCLIYCEKKKD